MATKSKQGPKSVTNDPDAHVISRHFQLALRVLLIVAIVATIVLMVYYREAAYLAAIPIPVLYIALVAVNYYEQRSRAARLRKGQTSQITKDEVQVDVQVAGFAAALKVAGALALGTFIIAATLFDLASVAFVAAIAFLLAIFTGLPYWPLIVSEAENEEREKVTKNLRSREESKAVGS